MAKNRTFTMKEILQNGLAEEEKRQKRTRWGDWRYYPNSYTLKNTKCDYEVALNESGTSAELLDWVFQLLHKGWGTPQVIHDFLTAVDDLLDPQANYCSTGIERNPDPKKLLGQRRGRR